MIWSHKYVVKSESYLQSLPADKCAYCSLSLVRWDGKKPDVIGSSNAWSHPIVMVCNSCGWWYVTFFVSESIWPNDTIFKYATAGQLKPLDVNDISVPLSELRKYLLAKRDARFQINPKRFEDIVGGIFRVTSYSGDKGIDVAALDGSSNTFIGIQVKRYKNKIEAEQIRSFVGALMLGGYSKGVFVTTSAFRTGAIETVGQSAALGLPIELWDGDNFIEKLGIERRPAYKGIDDESAPFHYFVRSPESMQMIESFEYSGSAYEASTCQLESAAKQAADVKTQKR